jgi:hypothetical protein
LGVQFLEILEKQSVGKGTGNTYQSVWINKWKPFLQTRDILQNDYLFGIDKASVEVLIVEFMLDMATTTGVKPGTVFNALASVKHFLALHNPAALESLGDSSILLKKTKAAISKMEERKRVANRTPHKEPQSPMTLDMIHWLRAKYWSNISASTDEKMTYLAILVGFNGLMRECEFVDKSNRTEVSPICGGDLYFEVNRDRLVYSTQQIREANIPSQQVIQVTVSIPFTKTNKSGEAKVCTIKRSSSEECGILIDSLVTWCTLSGISDNEVLFSRYSTKGTYKKLTSFEVSKMIKEVAIAHGLPESALSSRSLRIGGRTTLNNSGAEIEQIMAVGGWASGAHKIYQRPTKMDEGALSVITTDKRILTSSDILQLGHQHN